MTDKYRLEIENLKKNGNYRRLTEPPNSNLLDLCSNDYLGINNNQDVHGEFLEKINIKHQRFSSGSSRLLSGNTEEHAELERVISGAYNKRPCLIFNSGYHANVGILPALTTKKDLIIADKLVHASIIDGCMLSKAQFIRYRHKDYTQLEKILEEDRNKYENVFIVSESIFSMDGDRADLKKLTTIKKQHGCFLYIDEAHAVGAIGQTGLGCSEEEKVIGDIDFIMGTFGKALASIGAYLICDEVFKEYLINHSRTLIYTTALPPVNLAWSKHIFKKLPDLNNLREKLKTLSNEFAEMIGQKASSHIVPFIIGENHEAISASGTLKKSGFNTLPIRYPTVPKGTARLRFSLRADIDFNQLEPLKKTLLLNE